MEKSTVYFTDFRCKVGTSQLDKLKKLCIAAGIKNIDMDGKFVAIKIHFGELGNLAFLRPNYAKVVADLCKELGGMPFLTDCNTLYPGSGFRGADRGTLCRPEYWLFWCAVCGKCERYGNGADRKLLFFPMFLCISAVQKDN